MAESKGIISSDGVDHMSLRYLRDLCEGFGHHDPGIKAHVGR